MGLHPAGGTDSFPPQRVQTISVTHKMGKGGFAGINGVGWRRSPLIPCNVEVKNKWNHISTPSFAEVRLIIIIIIIIIITEL